MLISHCAQDPLLDMILKLDICEKDVLQYQPT